MGVSSRFAYTSRHKAGTLVPFPPPNGLPADQHELLDSLNEEIVQSVQREGFHLISKTQVGSRIAIGISINSSETVREDIDATFEAIARCGRLLTRKQLISVS